MKNPHLFEVSSSNYSLIIDKLSLDGETRYSLSIKTSFYTANVIFKFYDDCHKYLVKTFVDLERVYIDSINH